MHPTHALILGQTGSGKSTLLKEMMHTFRGMGITCIAFTSIEGDFRGWASEVYHDVDPFLQRVFQCTRCAIFVDESGEVTNAARIGETATLATRTRHLGHAVHFAAQRASGLVGPLVRDQCSRLYCFRLSSDDGKLLARDWAGDDAGEAMLRGARGLGAGEYIYVQRYPYRAERRQLDFQRVYGAA